VEIQAERLDRAGQQCGQTWAEGREICSQVLRQESLLLSPQQNETQPRAGLDPEHPLSPLMWRDSV
jgi:hypothetical protein